MAIRLVTTIIIVLATMHVAVAQNGPDAIRFGWVVSDGGVFAEVPLTATADDYLERFTRNFDPESFDEVIGTVMCNYGRIDSIPEIRPVLRPGASLRVVVSGRLLSGVMDGYAYTRNPTTGYFFPGYHIELADKGELLPCSDPECYYFCVPALVIAMDDSLAAATKVVDIEKLDSASAPPAMVKFSNGIDLNYQAGQNDLCESRFYKIGADNFFIVVRVCRPESRAPLSRYFGAREAGGIFEFSEIDFAKVGPVGNLDFLDLVEIAGKRYLFTLQFGHESVRQVLYEIAGGRLELVSFSSTFGQ
jgi:hypothetical protein